MKHIFEKNSGHFKRTRRKNPVKNHGRLAVIILLIILTAVCGAGRIPAVVLCAEDGISAESAMTERKTAEKMSESTEYEEEISGEEPESTESGEETSGEKTGSTDSGEEISGEKPESTGYEEETSGEKTGSTGSGEETSGEEAESTESGEETSGEIPEGTESGTETTEALSETASEEATAALSETGSSGLRKANKNAAEANTLLVYQVNTYKGGGDTHTILVQGGSVKDKLGSSMSFLYWTAVIVEKDSSTGKLYVKEYITAAESKSDCRAETEDGFVLLLNADKNNVTIFEGDIVVLDQELTAAYKTDGEYKDDGYGAVTFSSEIIPAQKKEKDNSSLLTTIQGADTRDFIELNLYDYGNNINEKYNSNKNYPGFQQEYGTKNWNISDGLNAGAFNFGNDITSDLDAGISGVTTDPDAGPVNRIVNHANSPLSGVMSKTLADGYPAVSGNLSLEYLFSDNTYARKQNSQSINGLFLYDEVTGTYTYNSRENHAQFNAGSDTFTLYDQILTPNVMMYPFGNFLPFSDITKLSKQAASIDRDYLREIASCAEYKYEQGMGEEYHSLSEKLGAFIRLMDEKNGSTDWKAEDCIKEYFDISGLDSSKAAAGDLLKKIYSFDYDEPADFYFGMEMKMDFTQPKNGLTGKDGRQPMKFYFTGDDDVYVYIDGTLILDLSGIHRHVGGEIDFVNGKVYYYNLDTESGDVFSVPDKTVSFSELIDSSLLNENGTFKDYSAHSFNFYYLERGSGSGVCRLNFNFPLLKQNSISVNKEVSTDDEEKKELLGNPDYRFRIMDENKKDLFIGAGYSYEIMDSSGKKTGTGKTDENGIFILKAGQTAVFNGINESEGNYVVQELLGEEAFAQYGKVTVNGASVTETDEVTIGLDHFNVLSGPVKNISDGSSSFCFNNLIETKKLGSLNVTKELIEVSGGEAAEEYIINVILEGEPLPVGTAYVVKNKANPETEETKQVTVSGQIVIKAGQTAVISDILSGTKFTIQESTGSSSGYIVRYAGTGTEEVTEKSREGVKYAEGVIMTDTSTGVCIKNVEPTAEIFIPVQKSLVNPDGQKHSYEFHLQQVNSLADMEETGGGTDQTITISVSDSVPQTGNFELFYRADEITGETKTCYYKITESIPEKAVGYDTSVWLAEVTVSREGGANGEPKAKLTKLFKAGAEQTECSKAEFKNVLNKKERLLPDTGGDGFMKAAIAGSTFIGAGIFLCIRRRRII